jgi:uncharacterized membrane protein YtjA (UPF0391 family)
VKTRNGVRGRDVDFCKPALFALPRKETQMLKWAIILAIVALIAGGLGFTGVAGAAAGVAKILFFLFVLGFVVVMLLGVTVFKAAGGPK